MSEEKHHSHPHFGHHHQEVEKGNDEVNYPIGGGDGSVDFQKENNDHNRKEHGGETAALASGGYALYEKREAKKNPEHDHMHKVEEEVAAATSEGAGGYTLHEHHKKKEAKENEEEKEGKKHHFF